MISKALLGVFLILTLAGQAVAEKVHLVAFGDSLTVGYGLSEADGFVPVLRAWMAAQGEDVQIDNAGVSGDTTTGGLARLDWALSEGAQGIIIEMGANDMLRGVDPAVARRNLDAMLQRVAARGLDVLLVGMPVAANYGADYKAEFEAIWPDLAERWGVTLYPNYFAGLGESQIDILDDMQGDGIHPNAEGVEKIVDAIGPEVQAMVARIRAKDAQK